MSFVTFFERIGTAHAVKASENYWFGNAFDEWDLLFESDDGEVISWQDHLVEIEACLTCLST